MIMAAGVGSRLEPLTFEVPKPLVPICNVPVMDILLQNLKNAGFASVIANTYYLAEQIHERYTNNSPIDIDFNYIKEEELSGTAGGVKKCQFFFDEDSSFLVVSADGLSNINFNETFEEHLKKGAIATMITKEVAMEEVFKYGVVVTDNDGFVKEFQEKPSIEEAKSNKINTGIYVFDYKIFDYIPKNTKYDFAKDVFPKLLKDNIKINTINTEAYWSDIGSVSQYIESNFDALSGKIDVTCIEKQSISKTADIEKSVEILDNTIIGNKSKVKNNAKLINSIIWDNVIIGEDVIVKDSVIASNSKIFNNIEGQILAPNSIIK